MNSPLAMEADRLLRVTSDPAKAPGMFAYMKEIQPFLGVSSPERKEISRTLLEKHRDITVDEWHEAVLELWNGPFREHRYLALSLAQSYKRFISPENLQIFVTLSEGCDWWDTTDDLATHVFNPLYLKYRIVEPVLLDFRIKPLLWQRRISLLAHLNHKEKTKFAVLEETIELLAPEKDFFIRKAIGWVLRTLGKTHPDYVAGFLRRFDGRLSPLSVREASKYLEKD